jgi:hypothetical protein
MKTLFLLAVSAVVLCLAACGPCCDDPCDRGDREADFQPQPMQGPGLIDGGVPSPDGGTYVISSTYLRMPDGDSAKQSFGKLTQPILQSLPTTDGLIGWSFGSSDSCRTARTLLVWRDTDSMIRFVGSEAHATAMGQVKTVSRGGSAVTHWTGTEADVSWEAAFSHLAAAKPLDGSGS